MSHRPQHAILQAHPLINARRQYRGMRIVVDNEAVADTEVSATLAMVTQTCAGGTNPLIVAFGDEYLPLPLGAWEPAGNTYPEFRGAWLKLPAARDMLAGGRFPPWCLNGAPGHALAPPLVESLFCTVDSDEPAPAPDRMTGQHPAAVRTGVRTRAEADALFAEGIDWVAGWPLQGAAAPARGAQAASRMLVVRLLHLAQTDADLDEIDALLRQDVGLAYKLLRFINSAANGLSVQVESFAHAVMILGYKRLTRWLALLLLSSSEDPNQLPLMGMSLRRAFFLEHIGRHLIDDINGEELFMTGLFSLLDKIFGQPLDDLLAQVNLPDTVANSLRDRGEPYGGLLRLAIAIEGDDNAMIRDRARRLGLNQADVNHALLLAIRDAERIEVH